MNDNIRFKTEQRKHTKIQRLRIWWNGVINAVCEIPDTHYSEYIRLEKGDSGYDEANWGLEYVEHSARCQISVPTEL